MADHEEGDGDSRLSEARKPPLWPRWLWVLAIVLSLLAIVAFIFGTAIWRTWAQA